jgi:hypothetical protein
MTTDELSQILIDAGYSTGWVIHGDLLILWEHKEDPPKPLKRPA